MIYSLVSSGSGLVQPAEPRSAAGTEGRCALSGGLARHCSIFMQELVYKLILCIKFLCCQHLCSLECLLDSAINNHPQFDVRGI